MKPQIKLISLPLIDYCIKTLRLLAMTGKKNFVHYVKHPLEYAGWERHTSTETSKDMMHRIDRYDDESSYHTIAPLCKRLVSLSVTEGLKNLGDSCIYFFDKMRYYSKVIRSEEAVDFVNILYSPLTGFEDSQKDKNSRQFEEKLARMSEEDLKKAVAPIELERYKIKVEFQKEAADLFKKISWAVKQDDLPRCQKLISTYLVKFAENRDNNREEVENLIGAFDARIPGFRKELEESMSIALYFEILAGITENNLRRTIMGIRKYAFIFQGNPEIKNYLEIDALEKKLYHIIDEKNLWDELTAKTGK